MIHKYAFSKGYLRVVSNFMWTVFGSFEGDQWQHPDGLICCCRKRQTTDHLPEDSCIAHSLLFHSSGNVLSYVSTLFLCLHFFLLFCLACNLTNLVYASVQMWHSAVWMDIGFLWQIACDVPHLHVILDKSIC